MKVHRIVILPSLFTLGNALCGFAAITFTTRAFLGEADIGFRDITIAGSFIFLAMVLDAIDGRLARLARATSDFGGQLDSLGDAISFGIAPAFLMHRVVVQSLGDAPGGFDLFILRTAWVCAAIYVSCVLIRLARFNVENIEDEEAHMYFRGLPSPPAAGLLTALVIVLNTFWQQDIHEKAWPFMLWALPAMGAVLGGLMVSRIRYVHLVNYLIKGKRPISYLGNILFVLAFLSLLFFLSPQITTAVGFGLFCLSGPVLALRSKLRPKGPPGAGADDDEELSKDEDTEEEADETDDNSAGLSP